MNIIHQLSRRLTIYFEIVSKSSSVAFFQTYLFDRPEFQAYLTASYARSISKSAMRLTLFSSATTDQIAQILAILQE
jgi:predicted dienelactone hydrolase